MGGKTAQVVHSVRIAGETINRYHLTEHFPTVAQIRFKEILQLSSVLHSQKLERLLALVNAV